jgi:hypothetical protein
MCTGVNSRKEKKQLPPIYQGIRFAEGITGHHPMKSSNLKIPMQGGKDHPETEHTREHFVPGMKVL